MLASTPSGKQTPSRFASFAGVLAIRAAQNGWSQIVLITAYSEGDKARWSEGKCFWLQPFCLQAEWSQRSTCNDLFYSLAVLFAARMIAPNHFDCNLHTSRGLFHYRRTFISVEMVLL